jgi:allantoinase
MTAFDLIVRGGTVVAPDGVRRADLGVADGRIAAIAPELAGGAGEDLDASGLHVLPGAVDAHVHFNDPGRTAYEGFESGTRAAAAGGTTTVVDMPLNALPPTIDGPAFDRKRAVVERDALVDVALWGGLVPGNADRLEELAARGVVGFKAFMTATGMPEFAMADDLTLYEGMQVAARLRRPVAVHAESEAITSGLAARARQAGRTAMRDYLRSRPAIAEIEAIGRALRLAEETGCPLHVVHVSTGRGVALVAEARARGVDATCETCPHYLVLDEDDAERIGAVAKCSPPLRPPAEREALWAALDDIAFVASDHSPSPPHLKASDDAFANWGGIAGVQALLGALVDAGHHGRGLALERIAELCAAGAARRLRLPGKGRLERGADADLALVDLTGTTEVTAESLHQRHPHGAWVGRIFRGRVVRTLARGRTVVAEGRVVAPPSGRVITPKEPEES